MKKFTLFLGLISVYLISMLSGCSEDDPPTIPTQSDAYPPGYVWQAGDYPSLTAPEKITDNVTIGDPIPAFTAINKSGFKPILTAVQSDYWKIRIYRSESALCELWYQWEFFNLLWSYSIPIKTYKFNWPSFPFDCWWHNDSELNKGGQDFWPRTQTRTFTLMANGTWVSTPISFTNANQNWGGNTYDVVVTFNQLFQSDLYISMVRTWVVGQKADDDVIRTQGEAEVTVHTIRGVEISDTRTFTDTWGMNAGATIEGISVGLNATFSTTTSHTVNLTEIEETTETRYYNVPANEQWRYITIYGVERYKFTDISGNNWTSDYLDFNYLGSVDNNVRTFLMIVKYNAGSDIPYSSDLIEIENKD